MRNIKVNGKMENNMVMEFMFGWVQLLMHNLGIDMSGNERLGNDMGMALFTMQMEANTKAIGLIIWSMDKV